MQKKHKHMLVPSQKYQDSRHLLQNPTVPNHVMGFSNRAQRCTGSNYLDVDGPFTRGVNIGYAFLKLTKLIVHSVYSCKKGISIYSKLTV